MDNPTEQKLKEVESAEPSKFSAEPSKFSAEPSKFSALTLRYLKISDVSLRASGLEEDTKTLRRVARACSMCPGYCCRKFMLPKLDVISEELGRARAVFESNMSAWLRVSLLNRFRCPDVETKRPQRLIVQLRELLRHEKDVEFMKNNFVVLEDDEVYYTCKKFENGACTAYADRPLCCSSYACGAAFAYGMPPSANSMVAVGRDGTPSADMLGDPLRPVLDDAAALVVARVASALMGDDASDDESDSAKIAVACNQTCVENSAAVVEASSQWLRYGSRVLLVDGV